VTLSDEFIMSAESMLVTPEDYANHRLRVEEFVCAIRSARDKRPTALFVSFDRLANLVYWEAIRQGVRIPDELSIVSFGGNRTLGSTPHLASVIADEFQTGQRACELIDEIHVGTRPIAGDARFPIAISFDEGETLARPGK
jgi:DNA-binding LacI/PurR family transcriptional regulator